MTKVSLHHYQLLPYITHPVFLKIGSLFSWLGQVGSDILHDIPHTDLFFCNKTEVFQQEIVERITKLSRRNVTGTVNIY